MDETSQQSRVPARLVLASLFALWACYFIVATLRGAFLGFEFDWPIISRRLTICIVSVLVMAAIWPLLQLLDRRSFGVRVAAVLIGAFPVSLALGAINEAVFADINGEPQIKEGTRGTARVISDESGDLMVDIPRPPSPPRAPDAPLQTERKQGTMIISREGVGKPSVVIRAEEPEQPEMRWAVIADTAFGRYFLVLAWAALYFALAKAEEARAAERREGEFRRAAAASELRSLRYQVNPHFLFNTLNSLSALVMTGKQDAAEQMIQTLSTFYRHTLSGDPTNDLPLADEIELQRLYLAIESVRFPERLLTRIAIDEAVRDAMVPGMILQPLVENSVKYAVAATREPVTITIAARAEAEWLVLAVSDDGPGTKDETTQGCGIGLGNVRDRLRARFGGAASVAFGSQEQGGFATTIRMPLEHRRG